MDGIILSMEEIPAAIATESPCSLHNEDGDLNRRGVRDGLRALVAEAMAVLCHTTDDELEDIKALPVAQVTQDYASVRTARLDQYRAILEESTLGDATGRFTHYTIAGTNARHATPILQSPMVPIGEYDETIAQDLLRAAVQAVALSERKGDEIEAIGWRTQQTTDLLRRHTFKGRTYNGSLLVNIQEGLVGVAQSLALLTAERPLGNPLWRPLAENILSHDSVTKYARRIGGGLLSRQVLYGHYIPGALQYNGELSDNLLNILATNKQATVKYVDRTAREISRLKEEIEAAYAIDDEQALYALAERYYESHFTASSTLCAAADPRSEIYSAGRLLMRLL